MKIKVIIGAGWGDEGKGLLTDAFASLFRGDCTVVRFNGGGQAGHTVETPEGRRHIFSNFGSGTFTGAETYLSEYFIVNPILMMKEYEKLKNDLKTNIVVNYHALVTTPYDMIINHLFEKKRGFKSSCGVGINETVTRALNFINFNMLDLKIHGCTTILNNIRDRWVRGRLNDLGINPDAKECKELLENNDFINQWKKDCHSILEFISDKDDSAAANFKNNIIFEGAQGLMLDQKYGTFPYVTRSNTGFRNASKIINRVYKTQDEINLEIIYVTRAYATRHGAGPLPNETPNKPYPGIVDHTNITNEYQGSLRFGYLDLNTLSKAINQDLLLVHEFSSQIKCKPQITLAVTCLDQMNDITFTLDDEYYTKNVYDFLDILKEKTGINKIITSYGPTRKTLGNSKLILK